MALDVQIEALLFYKASPQKKKNICKLFTISDEVLEESLKKLSERIQHGATRLIQTETEIQLVTAPEQAEFIESLRKQELSGDIGKAGAETLSIILYREPISRVEIDRIRGVNSSFILRNLLIRGLIVRESITGQGFQFRTSSQLLQHLGIEKKQDLPRFAEFMNAIDEFDSIEHE
jgi:segregation and condensation protein B